MVVPEDVLWRQTQVLDGAELLERSCLHEETPLLLHLSPQLLTCLLAEVAVGLLVPA
jgi:hypothetical protein